TTVSGSGNTLIVNWNLSFKEEFSNKLKNIYLKAMDDAYAKTSYVQKGTWTVIGNQPPQTGTVTPASGSSFTGEEVVFSTTYMDPNGWEDLYYGLFQINKDLSLPGSVYCYYYQNHNILFIYKDGTGWIGGYTPGSANTIENDYFILDCSKTTVSGLGNILTVNWNITFKEAFSNKNCNTYLSAMDDSSAQAPWAKKGTWEVSIADEEQFVIRFGNKLALKNSAKNYYFSSTNQYYLFYKEPIAMVDEVFNDAKAMGLNVVRTWGFCDGEYKQNAYSNLISFQPEAGVYHESGFLRMDYLIAKAKELDMRLIIPLVNNWDEFGGMMAYVRWSPTATLHDDFYTDATCKQLYKNYVSYFLNRVNTITGIAYKNDPTILVWELANEPRCESDTSGDTLQAWIEEMSTYIKTVDSNHLVSTGSEGWLDGKYGVDFARNHQAPNIDICTFHILFDDNSSYFNEAKAMEWFSGHPDIAHFTVGKPIYCGELGKKVYRTAGNGAQQMDTRNRLYTEWYGECLNRSIDGAGFWLLSANEYPDYDHYTVYYPEDTQTCHIVSSFSNQMAKLRDPNHIAPVVLRSGVVKANENENLEYPLILSNLDNFDLTFQTTNLPAGALIDGEGRLKWVSPVAGVYGNIGVTCFYDTTSSYTQIDLNILDINGNNTPQIVGMPQTINMDMQVNPSINNAVDLWAFTTDDVTPVSQLVFNATAGSSYAGVTLDGNRFIDISPASGYIGHTSILITAMDQSGLVGKKRISLNVTNSDMINVPSDYATIAQAMIYAGYGDTILVDSGTYNEAVTVRNGVKLISVSGAENTVILGGLILNSGNYADTLIQGFTITNPNGFGIVNGGWGHYVYPVIKNNVIKDCLNYGIAMTHSSAKIYNNAIEGNGGGLWLDRGAPEIINNVIINNNSTSEGGGIYIINSQGKVYNNIVVGNHTASYGGGIKGWALGTDFEIGYNNVYNNTAGGGGEHNYGTCPTGDGAISLDPLFENTSYSLYRFSPCINTGNPNVLYNDSDNSRNDMGIYGGPNSF
ncbi:MAG: cellulase family glycosylhydrolase, partial [Candidatus Omnitrophota bacterium]